jgi:hypothetical protein
LVERTLHLGYPAFPRHLDHFCTTCMHLAKC